MKMLTGNCGCCVELCKIATGIQVGQEEGWWAVYCVAAQHLPQGIIKPPPYEILSSQQAVQT